MTKYPRPDPTLVNGAAIADPKAGGGDKILGSIAREAEGNSNSHFYDFE